MKLTDFKYCTKCKAHHHFELFAKNWQTRDGRNSWCKKCHKAYRIGLKNSRETGADSATTALATEISPSAECS